MRLTAQEEERLVIFAAAELARRRRGRGLLLNHPEAVALICDAALEAARDGAGYDEVVKAALEAVRPDEVLDGVPELLDEVRVEVLLDDGTRLIVLVHPLGVDRSGSGPGALIPSGGHRAVDGAGLRVLAIRNDSSRVVRVGSHYPLERANRRLAFDRSLATGYRLFLPAGASERWEPGESKDVEIVPMGRPPAVEAAHRDGRP